MQQIQIINQQSEQPQHTKTPLLQEKRLSLKEPTSSLLGLSKKGPREIGVLRSFPT
jgi:hypothetical protein